MAGVLAELADLLGPSGLKCGHDIEPRHLHDWMLAAAPDQAPRAVAYPRNTAEVSAIMKLCSLRGVPVVAQGGLTGLTGAATPVKDCLVLSFDRMRRIEEVDADAATITVEAGVPLQLVQEAADDAGLFFPLDLGARGSCTVGGNLSTNAGGNRVIRFGMARDLVLGLEVVLADGTVISALNKMLKNNAGYDVKQLFLGTEGTLGVITRAVLRLHPKAAGVSTSLCAVADFDQVRALLRLMRRQLGGAMSAFEYMCPNFYSFASRVTGRQPVPVGHGGYVLIETMGPDAEAEQARCQAAMEKAFDEGVVADAVIAQSGDQTAQLWDIRDSSGRFKEHFAPHVNFDVSIPIGDMKPFLAAVEQAMTARWPGVEIIVFGHVADSNLHLTIRAPVDPHPEDEIEHLLYDTVRRWKGSISAEHGIGVLKKPFLGYSVSPEAIALMRRLKTALDPQNLLNPGKVLP